MANKKQIQQVNCEGSQEAGSRRSLDLNFTTSVFPDILPSQYVLNHNSILAENVT